MFSSNVRNAVQRVYVPNSLSNTVDVIDPLAFKRMDRFKVGILPQHITPSYDEKTLYVLNDKSNTLTAIDPLSARPAKTIPLADPYNLYFTLEGRFAIVVAERLRRLDFRDARSFALRHSLAVPCQGINHMDFSTDGTYALASCEFSRRLLRIDIARQKVAAVLNLPRRSMPHDVKLSADGRTFYVADSAAGGVWRVRAGALRVIGFVATGKGAHGLCVSRDGAFLYVSNRAEGSVSVIDSRAGKVVSKWRIAGGASPDMGGVSADGNVLWLSGRYDGAVYAIDTRTGQLLKRIRVERGPHGLAVWPQPGRFSLGHTGVMR